MHGMRFGSSPNSISVHAVIVSRVPYRLFNICTNPNCYYCQQNLAVSVALQLPLTFPGSRS